MVVTYIQGKRTACIKKYIDKDIACPACNMQQLEVKIYRPYAHVCLIPFLPDGDKAAEIRCKHCGEPYNMYVTKQAYAAKAKTPWWMYSGILIVALFLLGVFGWLYRRDKLKEQYIAAPMVGDIYTFKLVENHSSQYILVKVKAISGDSLFVYHTNYSYSGANLPLSDEDHFVKGDLSVYTRPQIKKLMDDGTLVTVQRDYSASKHYDREQ